jgi:hypothetical protein
MDRKTSANRLFLLISILATLFVLLEMTLQAFGKTTCPNEGCKIVGQSVRFGESSIFIAGAVAFGLIAFLSYLESRSDRPLINRLINLILIVSLAGEGFFVGYQTFAIHTFCVFCLIIFGLFFLLASLRWMAGENEMAAGFAAFAVVFSLHYLLLPAAAPVKPLPVDRLVLFYSKDCKHCEEIIREFDEQKISAARVVASEYAGYLKNLGIETVPTLLVNDPTQKVVLTGEETIRAYFRACAAPAAKSKNPTQSKKSVSHNAKPSAPAGSVDIFNSGSNLLITPPAATDDPGVCKQDAACK